MLNTVSIGWMVNNHLPEVIEIENASFAQPWDTDQFNAHRKHPSCVGKVVEIEERVVAFVVWEGWKDHIRIINLAVHPDYRRRGLATLCIQHLQDRLTPDGMTYIVALVPESCHDVEPFFRKFGSNVRVRPTSIKGKYIPVPVLSAMTSGDVSEVQKIDDAIRREYRKESRDISVILATESQYGIIARDKYDGLLLGYVIYRRDICSIQVDGEFGVMVRTSVRRRGIGRMLMMELIHQKRSIIVSDIRLACSDQMAFLRAIGVPVLEPQKFATVQWV